MRKVVLGEKHFCASVWILTKKSPKKLLLIRHKKLGKWMQPGGHVEKFENPVETAVREVKEETGLDISFLTDQIDVVDEEGAFLPLPKFTMEQTIPPHKKEPLHYHIDINYVVETDEQEVFHNQAESKGIGWFTKSEALSLPIHGDTREVINKIMR